MSDTAGSRNNGSRDDAAVDRLLLEAGLDDDVVLRSALQELRGLAGGQPEASAAVAALMMPAVNQAANLAAATRHLAVVPETALVAGTAAVPQSEPAVAPAAASAMATDELAARRRAKRRMTLTTLSVAVSLAAGSAVAVASDQGIRDSIGHAVTSFVAGAGGGPSPAKVENPVPAPGQPAVPAAGPTEPTSTLPDPAAPGSGPTQAVPQNVPSPSGSAPAGPLSELPVAENVVPGGPLDSDGQAPGQEPSLPLPTVPPVPLPGVHP